jgi:hypothetical protein
MSAPNPDLEALRSALYQALCYWSEYYNDLKPYGAPTLLRAEGHEGDDYRYCLALLDRTEAEGGNAPQHGRLTKG